MYKNVYSRFIHNCQNLETTNMSFGSRMDKQLRYIHTMSIVQQEKETSYQAMNHMEEP